MKFIGDFHIHSHYSRATSKQLIPEYLDYWARIKGVNVIGTGDFTHPEWLKELKEKLEPAEQGLFKLKEEFKINDQLINQEKRNAKVRFLLTSEISNIYKKTGKVRKVHNLVFAPEFDTVEKIQSNLQNLNFNITSDGRPILGLDSRDLLDLILNISDDCFFVPAHIWTPWFSALGSKSGFDTIVECFGDLSNHIYAVETGLSTNPPMNWMCSFLDKYTLISNSDAHSPEKLGRNANLLNTELSYNHIIDAIKTGNPKTFLGTIDMYPQEGKYHYDGHRKCNVCWNPVETLRHNNICSVCGKKVTVGVTNRIVQLSDRVDINERPNKLPFYSIIPLKEIISEIAGVGPNSKHVTKTYNSIINKAGTELDILLNLSIEEIKKAAGEQMAIAIKRMRNNEVIVNEGFDGEYGTIKLFDKGELQNIGLNSLFNDGLSSENHVGKIKLLNFDLKEYKLLKETSDNSQNAIEEDNNSPTINIENFIDALNKEQLLAAEHINGTALIVAGPGTGKTRVLTSRIANLILNKKIAPENILAVTFTNKAAEEMLIRLKEILIKKIDVNKLNISTFHEFGLSVLKKFYQYTDREKNFSIIDEEDKNLILKNELKCGANQVKKISKAITEVKQMLKTKDDIEDNLLREIFENYQDALKKLNAFDLDDLNYFPYVLFNEFTDVREFYKAKFQFVMIDEYQDINFAQYHMIKKIIDNDNPNLCVIGDPNQAIYSFRGSDVKFIKQFTDDFKQAKIFELNKSYRCSNNIIKASKDIIKSEDSVGYFLQGIDKGVKIRINEHQTDRSEAEFVARTIEAMIGGLRFFSMDSGITTGDDDNEQTLSDFVVLCRLKNEMDELQQAFKNHSIPYQIVGEKPFFKEEPIKSIIDIMSFCYNEDNVFLRDKIIAENKISLSNLNDIKVLIKYKPVKKAIEIIVNNFFQDKKNDFKKEIKRLIDLSSDYDNDFEKFLRFVALGVGTDTYNADIENVTIMTLHAAKGLEFKSVFIIGCEDGLLPYSLFENQKADTNEEKRLLYVGMTRAKKHLFLSNARRRFIKGREYILPRSPFINNIEKELIDFSKIQFKKKTKEDDTQLSLF